jgi:hypothetical protein
MTANDIEPLVTERRRSAALQARLDAIAGEIEGYIDGSPDASEISCLANRISQIIARP